MRCSILAILMLLAFAVPASAQDNAPAARVDQAVAGILEHDVAAAVREFAGLGSRVLGYPGNLKAADAIVGRLEAFGFTRLGWDPWAPENKGRTLPDRALLVDQFTAPVPMDRGATLEIGDATLLPYGPKGAAHNRVASPISVTLYPLWPNLVRTSQLPRNGVSGHLVYVGKGTYREMDGKRMDGSIALMDFNCGKNYVNVRDMGAQAILFIEPDETWFTEAEQKMIEIPVSIPRFWVKREDAERLLRGALGAKAVGCPTLANLLDAASQNLTGRSGGMTVAARANCRMPWERGEGRNVYALIYGSDPKLRNDLIVVQTYYDSISIVPSLAPGANTTGGIVGLLKLAEFFKQHPPKRSVLLLATGSHFVQWEGIVDWTLRHAPRGGTEANAEVKAGATTGEMTPEQWRVELSCRMWWRGATAGLLLLAAVAALLRRAHWLNRGRSPQRRVGRHAGEVPAEGSVPYLADAPARLTNLLIVLCVFLAWTLAALTLAVLQRYDAAAPGLVAAIERWLPVGAAAAFAVIALLGLVAARTRGADVPGRRERVVLPGVIFLVLGVAAVWGEYDALLGFFGSGLTAWLAGGAAVGISLGLVAIIVMSSIKIRNWTGLLQDMAPGLGAAVLAIRPRQALASGDPAAERRAEGLGGLRFVASLFLLPAAAITILGIVEKPFSYSTPEPLPLEAGVRVKFFFSLDLSSASSDLGVFFTDPALYDSMLDKDSQRGYMDQYAKRLTASAKQQQIQERLGVRLENCVDPTGRWAADFVPMSRHMLDGTAILRTGNPCLTLFTIEDPRERADTPLDLPSRVNAANLTAQIRATVALLAAAADDPAFLDQNTSQVIRDRVKRVTTRVVEANYRESFVADTPVLDAIVVYRQGWSNWIPASSMNHQGVRGYRLAMTDARGRAVNRFVQAAGAEKTAQLVEIRPYRLSADDGRIIYAPDRGEQGEKSYPIEVTITNPETEHQVVAFQCEPLDLYQVENPRYLRAVGSGGGDPPIVFDVNDAAPQEYGFDFLKDQNIRLGKTENTAVVYVKKAPPGTKPNRVKFILGSTVFGVEYLLTNTAEPGEDNATVPQGVGFAAWPDARVPNSGLHFARDVIGIDDSRMKRFVQYGVVRAYDPKKSDADNERLALIHHLAMTRLTAAETSLSEARYHDFRTQLDHALGYEARAYPDVKGTANDIVKGFLFYCVLLLPFAYFCERLFLGFPDIRKQLFGFAGFFLLIFGLMAIVHPVFRITDAPYVILLAFVILVLAVSVLGIIIAKFNEQMAKMRRSAAKVHEADVGRLSATGTAIILGISNMKKRKVRTTLTTLTLVLLTFTVMSFTSVKTETFFNQIPQSHKANYTGLLLRDRGWFAQEAQAVEQFRRHFEPKGRVVPRAWMSATDPNAQRNYNFVIAADNGATVDCQGLVGMMPEETRALNLEPLLLAGRWFRTPDEPSVVLPSKVAFDILGLKKADVDAGRAKVRLRGRELLVVGVLDSARLEPIRDLDDEPYTPLDMATKSTFGAKLKGGMFSENLVEIEKLPHVPTDATAIVPFGLCMRLDGRIASAAVVFDEGYDFEPDLKAMLERVGMTVFMGSEGRVKAYSSIALSSVGRVGNLFIPILIAALIVLNTMMGSVHERAREIAIYSSVGLAPRHIGFLFLAESCVYAVMGAIAGYLLGTFLGKGVSMLDIPGLTLNYSSLSAVFSTLVVMATVLLSTIYPAKMAANMAVPDVTRQWKFPDPVGDTWKFDFPFTVASKGVVGLFVFLDNYFASYREESIGSFYADHIRFYSVKDVYGTGCVVELDCWLAPFDLSVSQNVQLRALPTEDEGITRIEVCITRLSGEVGNWTRLNRGFLTLMRKQFLIWRTVPPGVKEEYMQQGREQLRLGEALPEGNSKL